MARRKDVPAQVSLQALRKKGGTYYRLRFTPLGAATETIEALGYIPLAEAQDARERRQAELLLGVSPSSSRPAWPTVADVLTQYGDDLVRRVGEDMPYVANVVNRTAPLIRHLGAVFANRITETMLTSYAHDRAKEPGGRRGNRLPKRSVITDELKLLRRAVRWYGERHPIHLQVPTIPALKGIRPDARPKRRLSLAELGRIIGALEARGAEAEARLVEFMAWCPRRPVAILHLTRADCARVLVSPEAHEEGDIWISTDKGDVGLGWSPLLPRAREVLREHLRLTLGPGSAPVFTRADATAWTNQSLRGLLVRACERAGVDQTQPYDLRRFGVTRALRACGGDPEATMAFTGHTSAATVLRYAYADRDVVRAAARGET